MLRLKYYCICREDLTIGIKLFYVKMDVILTNSYVSSESFSCRFILIESFITGCRNNLLKLQGHLRSQWPWPLTRGWLIVDFQKAKYNNDSLEQEKADSWLTSHYHPTWDGQPKNRMPSVTTIAAVEAKQLWWSTTLLKSKLSHCFFFTAGS